MAQGRSPLDAFIGRTASIGRAAYNAAAQKQQVDTYWNAVRAQSDREAARSREIALAQQRAASAYERDMQAIYAQQAQNSYAFLDSEARKLGISRDLLAKQMGFNSEREAIHAQAWQNTQATLRDQGEAYESAWERKLADLRRQGRQVRESATNRRMGQSTFASLNELSELGGEATDMLREQERALGREYRARELDFQSGKVGFRETAAQLAASMGLNAEDLAWNRGGAREDVRLGQAEKARRASYERTQNALAVDAELQRQLAERNKWAAQITQQRALQQADVHRGYQQDVRAAKQYYRPRRAPATNPWQKLTRNVKSWWGGG